MKIIKFFALSLLALAPLAFATINLEIEVIKDGSKIATFADKVELNQQIVIFAGETLRVDAVVVFESENSTFVNLCVLEKNEAGEWINTSNPQLLAVDNAQGSVTTSGFDFAVRTQTIE